MMLNGTANGMGNITDNDTALRPVLAGSLGVWMKPTAYDIAGLNFAIIRQDTWILYLDSGRLSVSFDGTLLSSSTVAQNDTWYHLAGVKNATDGSLRLYVNGTETDVTWTNTSVVISPPRQHSVGCLYQAPSGNCFTGQVDNLTLYNGTWTPTQVANFHTGTEPPANATYYFEQDAPPPAPPALPGRISKVVVEVSYVNVFTATDGLFYTINANVTYRDPLSGTSLTLWSLDGLNEFDHPDGLIPPSALTDIAGRTAWRTWSGGTLPYAGYVPLTTPVNQAWSNIFLEIHYADGDTNSCVVNVTAARGTYYCGDPGFPGIASLTHETLTEFPPLLVTELRHPWSSPDAILANISYQYQIRAGAIWTDTNVNFSYTTSGIVHAFMNTTDWAADLLTVNDFRARARDDLTHEVSPWSCIVQARIGSTALGPYSCIGTTNALIPGASSGPTFPLADVPGLAAGLGLSPLAAAATLGGLFMISLVAFAGSQGGMIAAFIAGTCSIAFMYVLNILPAWGLVVMFVVAAAIVAFRWGGNRSEGGA